MRESEPLSFVSTFAWSGMEPLRLVVHQADGSWQFLCGTTVEIEHVLTMHAQHVFERFPDDLRNLAGLPSGFIAARDCASEPWSIEPESGDERQEQSAVQLDGHACVVVRPQEELRPPSRPRTSRAAEDVRRCTCEDKHEEQ